MAAYLLDTNIIYPIVKRNEDGVKLKGKILSVLKRNDYILLCPVVFYEIARGLYHSEAKQQLAFFWKLAEDFEWRDLTESTWDSGAKKWAECRKEGMSTDKEEGLDVDVLIAAQAEENDAVVVTRNVKHFQYLGVAYETW
jgi:predicted nucleic acid-binding protein